METIKYTLTEDQMPQAWYNIQADLPTPLPPVLHPQSRLPIAPGDLEPLFPMSLIQQEVSTDRWIEIPPEVQAIYRQWRPTPLYRARLACFAAGVTFGRTEGILPAPEANHAVKKAIDEALRCKEEGVSKTILFNLCGHGHFDMQAYIDYHAGKLYDREYSTEDVAIALAGLPVVAV